MKVPVLPTIAAALCVVLSLWLVIQTFGIRSGREALLNQQADNRVIQQAVEKQNEELQRQQKVFQSTQGISQIRQGDLQRQQKVLEDAKQLAEKTAPQILSQIGYIAAKNKNAKLTELLKRERWQTFIPTPDQLKKIDEEAAARAGKTPAPAAPPAPSR